VATSAFDPDKFKATTPEQWQKVGEALGEFEDADGLTGPCELLVGTATR
jgi:hypothetical protein